MVDKNLFSEFEPVSEKAFKQKIQYDLKGEDYNEKLIWQSPEGIHVKPFYHNDNASQITIPDIPKKWAIAEPIFIDDLTIASNIANDVIERGAEAIYFTAVKVFDFKKLIKNISKDIPLYFDLAFLDHSFYKELLNYKVENKLQLSISIDIIGNLAKDGNWFYSLKEDHQILESLLDNGQNAICLTIQADTYQEAGATMVQQLAYSLAHINEYFNHFAERFKKHTITIKISVANNYFFEIAKLRALRLLYTTLAQEYNLDNKCYIIATPARRMMSIYDYNNNMLRSTTACMSAILGSADIVINTPYDVLYHKSNEFGQRIARNQLLILKEESNFKAENNPAQGSYYIEELTQELATKALSVFKEIEQGGGFLKQLKEGIIQKKIKQAALKEQELFDKGEKVILGVNKHPNPEDKMKNDLELFPFVKQKPRKTLIEPIIPKRLAEEVEKKRINEERE